MNDTKRPSPTMVRHLDTALMREVRAEAIRRQVPTGEMLNRIIREWIARKDQES